MLYVSRILSLGRVEVTDSDDNSTEVLSYQKIKECIKYGVEISGCKLSEDNQVIAVCSIPESRSLSAKYALLTGLNVQVKDGVLMSLSLTNKFNKDCVLRLSDVCTSVAKNAIKLYVTEEETDSIVTLIIDSNVDIEAQSFAMLYNNRHFILDVTDMNKISLKKLYEYIVKNGGYFWNMDGFKTRIIDKDSDRFWYWAAELLLNSGSYALENSAKLTEEEWGNLRKNSELLYKRHKRYFANCLDVNFDSYKNATYDATVILQLHLKDIVKGNGESKQLPVTDKRIRSIMDIFYDSVGKKKFYLEYINNYIKYFNAVEEVKMGYVKLVENVCTFIKNL